MPKSKKKTHSANDQEAIKKSQAKRLAAMRDENLEGLEASESQRVEDVKSTLEADQAAFREGQVDAQKTAETRDAEAREEDPRNFPEGSTAESRSEALQESPAEEGIFAIEGAEEKDPAAEEEDEDDEDDEEAADDEEEEEDGSGNRKAAASENN